MFFTKSQFLAAAVLAGSISSIVAIPIASDITDIEAREYIEGALAELEARTHGDGSIVPTPESNNPRKKLKSKVKQVQQVLALTKHKKDEPHHPSNAPGNKATVHDHFHQSPGGGARHATVDFHNAQGQHVTRLHIHPDGKRLTGPNSPVHAPGTHAPPNSPSGNGHRKSTLRRREVIDYLEDLLERDLGFEDELD